MTATALLGMQWGDEGKGKLVDCLAGDYTHVVRFNGGDNAGHAVKVRGRRFGLELVPSAVFHAGVAKVIGAGVVVNPDTLLSEVAAIEHAGLFVDELAISERAHVVLPWHCHQDAASGARTTRKGIGPAYQDKMARLTAIRVGDLRHLDQLAERLRGIAVAREATLGVDGRTVRIDVPGLMEVLGRFQERFAHQIQDTTRLLNRALDDGGRVLLEGAQGALLDVDHGTYPYVTSSAVVAGGACTGAGIAPRRLDRVIGVVKAYMTRVGSGPFPTEASPEAADLLRQRGLELGIATGLLRRCGWLDLVALKHAVMLNQPSELALTKLDVIGTLPEIRLCVGYRHNGRVTDEFPASARVLSEVEPVYETAAGWPTIDRAGWRTAHRNGQLPARVAEFCDRVSRHVGVRVGVASFGPERADTIVRSAG